jgi:hypothetical protein
MSQETKKDTSVIKDWAITVGSVVGFLGLLQLATWVSAAFGFTGLYDVVDIASVAVKVAVASALAWTVKKIVFPATLGKDFGATFNEGWKAMPKKEKTRWIIGMFMALFVTIMFTR